MLSRLLLALGLLRLAGPAAGHGRLIEPPSRASAWRYGFATPHNYNDHELYCGGFSRQWSKNGGNCGVCGDAWDQPAPRPHEYGGRFGQGVTVRRYLVNSVVTLRVELTANHNGYFQFRMCPHMENTTQECLDRHVLRAERGGEDDTKFYPTEGNKIYEMRYRLPQDLTCEHCVIQWRYIAGNNWGTCDNGTGAVGCGHQEEFRACADVAVGLTGQSVIPTVVPARSRPPYVAPTRTTTAGTAEPAETATTAPAPRERSVWPGLLAAALTLCAVLVGLALLYLYYYRGGRRIKSLLMRRGAAAPAQPPVRPPRHKKPAETAPEIKTDIDNNIEPGFETIKLNENKMI